MSFFLRSLGWTVAGLFRGPLQRLRRGLWLCLLLAGSASAAVPQMDLRDWMDPQSSRVLAGEWQLTWREPQRAAQRVSLPFTWEDSHAVPWGRVGFGQIELSTELLLPEHEEPLALYIDDVKSAVRIWIDDKLVAHRGRVGDAQVEVPRLTSMVVPLRAEGGVVSVRIELSNHFHREGGIDMPVLVGSFERLTRHQTQYQGLSLFMLGGCLLIALFLLLLGRWNNSHTLNGPFSLMLTLAALRAAASGGVLDNLLALPALWVYRIEYLPAMFYPGVYCLLLRSVFPEEVNPFVTRLLLWLSGLAVAVVLFTPLYCFSLLRDPSALVIVLASLYFIGCLLLAVWRGKTGALSVLIGFLILTGTVANDIALNIMGLMTYNLVAIGALALLMSHGLVLGRRVLATLKSNIELSDHLQALNANLERRVEQRTEGLRRSRDLLDNTLEHMQSALLSIDGAGLINALNQRFKELFGLQEVPRHFTELQRQTQLGLSASEGAALIPPPGQPARGREYFHLANGMIMAVRRRALADRGWVATYEDVTAEHLAQMDVQGGEMGYWKFELKARQLSCSELCWRMLGYSRLPDDEQLPAQRLWHPEDRALLRASLRAARRCGNLQISLRVRRADGAWSWVALRARCILDAADKPRHWVGVVEDVDLQVLSLQALEQARDKAVRDARQTAEMLAMLSHELRTPLVAIEGHLALLLDEVPEHPQLQVRLGTALGASRGLTGMMNGLLVMAQVDDGGLEAFAPLDLHGLLGECTDLLRLQATDKGLTLELDCPVGAPGWVRGSASAMRQIFYNLVGNAIKFSAQGVIRVRLETRASGITLTVTDSGPGIALHRQTQIFSPFARQQQHKDLPGIGLGLFVVRRLTEAMGGSTSLHSQPRVGSCFRVDLPWPLVASPLDTGRVPGISLEGLDVLLVEDVAVSRAVLRELLIRWGCQVDTVADGHGAVERCRQRQYDLVLMDMGLPDIDGLVACRLIREQNAECGHLLLALTANAGDLDRASCQAAGLDGVLAKPLQLEQLQAALGGVDTFEWLPSAASGTGLDEPLDERRLLQLRQWLGGPLFDRLLPTLIDSLHEVRDQLAALQREPPGADGQLEAVLHRLRGSAVNFGLNQLADQALQVRHATQLGPLLVNLEEHLQLIEGWLADTRHA